MCGISDQSRCCGQWFGVARRADRMRLEVRSVGTIRNDWERLGTIGNDGWRKKKRRICDLIHGSLLRGDPMTGFACSVVSALCSALSLLLPFNPSLAPPGRSLSRVSVVPVHLVENYAFLIAQNTLTGGMVTLALDNRRIELLPCARAGG